MTEAPLVRDQHVVIIGGANSAGQAAVYFAGYAGRSRCSCAPGSSKSMSQYLIEQLARYDNVESALGCAAMPPANGRLRALAAAHRRRKERIERTRASCHRLAVPRTDWLEGVVARDERGLHPRRARRARLRLAAGARPAALETSVPGRVRRRRRARAVDQARGQRGRRGLDGRLAHASVPGRRVSSPTLAELRTIDLFDDLDDARLGEWAPVCELRDVRAGEVLAEQGMEPPGVWLLLEGAVQALLVEGERTEPIGRQEAPTWLGAIATLTGGPIGVRMVATDDTRAALVPHAEFRRLAMAQPEVHDRVMKQVAPVMSRVNRARAEPRTLTSLGTMAAGLAHELNNPAAAAQRAATLLAEALETVNAAWRDFVASGVEREQAAELVRLHQRAVDCAAKRTALSGLDAADAEDELLQLLEDAGVPDAWRLAEPLAAAGIDEGWLKEVSQHAGTATRSALEWVAATLTARGLAEELKGRDAADVDARRRGEELLVHGPRCGRRGRRARGARDDDRRARAQAQAHDDRGAPRVRPRPAELTVHGSELNQVWTNLLDNAIDALGETGTITITTSAEGGGARVEIADDGPGIPDEIRERIFDSFFTTKDVGKGTGLGLATARQIVVERHGGTMTVESEPGRTAFRIWLPFGGAAG
jgi:signal transduction histidine kinase